MTMLKTCKADNVFEITKKIDVLLWDDGSVEVVRDVTGDSITMSRKNWQKVFNLMIEKGVVKVPIEKP